MMRLLLNTTSPFARLARVVAIEKNLLERLELVWCDPWADDPQLLDLHPQGRIPVLQTEDGAALSESLLIALYLDRIGSGPALLPPATLAPVLARVSLGYGMMEAAFGCAIARKHGLDQGLLAARRLAAIARTLARLEQDGPSAACPTLDQLAVSVALDYLDLRLPELGWRQNCPHLAAWQAEMLRRPSMRATGFGGAVGGA